VAGCCEYGDEPSGSSPTVLSNIQSDQSKTEAIFRLGNFQHRE
jgi:hypothetical protein